MTEERKKEIALLYVKYKMQKEAIVFNSETKRRIFNTAKEIGITPEEAMEFTELIVRERVENFFSRKKNQQKEEGKAGS